MYRISKQFHFSASHILHGLPEGHPCSRLHGHNYVVELVLESDTLDERGFMADYGDLSPFGHMLDDKLDHRHLNDVFPFNPTAENIACSLFEWAKSHWPQVAAVRVSETPKTWAEYRE